MWSEVPMRRKERATSEGEAIALLERGEWGVLASADAAGLPLATPLSYVMLEGELYFHCALEGHKMDNLAARSEVCFCVVGETEPVFTEAGSFSTRYESALVFGKAALVEDAAERERVLMALAEKYLPEFIDAAPANIEQYKTRTAVVRIVPGRITGKAQRPK